MDELMQRNQMMVVAVVATALVVAGCNSGPGTAAGLETFEDSASYSIGQGLGESITARNVEVIQAQVIQGLLDGLSGEGLLTREELLPLMQRLGEQAYNQRLEEEGGANQAAGEAYLVENGARDGVVTTESGLQYEVLEEGSGPRPVATDEVRVHYHGTLIDGTVFDSSYDRETPATFPVDGVIPGWREALPLMKPGATWQLFVPADLAYGENGAGRFIPPHSALVFEIELISING
jgi:FKBP-type peptidyl-prolyl cis-trans isomerase FklB